MAVSFSTELQDQLLPLSGTINTNLSFIGDIRSFYQARVELEREYAKGLTALVGKAQSKHVQITDMLVAGEAPSKQVREGAGRNHTLDTCWSTILAQTDEEAAGRSNYAESLQIDVCDSLKNLEKRMGALRTKHTEFGSSLLKERDATYNVKTKAKAKYDACCAEVEGYRQKQESAKSDKANEKARAGQAAAFTEMQNAKNVYLLSIDVSNRIKDKFYDKDLPSLHDDLQALWTTIVHRLKRILVKGDSLTQRQLEVLLRYNEICGNSVEDVDSAKDQALYVDYNKRPFFPASEFQFEPCAIWHDDASFSLEPEAKTFLQNKLSRDEAELSVASPKVSATRREVSKLNDLRTEYMKNPALGSLDDVTENYFEAIRQAVTFETEVETLQAEIDALKDALGDEARGSGEQHDFKASSFPVAKQCYVCQQKIWGMSKVGLTCRECHTHIHTGCELKCPADCGDPALPLQRAQNRNSTFSAPSRDSLDAPSLSKRMSSISGRSVSSSSMNGSSNGPPVKRAKALYDYASQSGTQLSMRTGEILSVVTSDSGNGWTKVSNSEGETGIVPSTYIKITEAAPPPPLSRTGTSSSRNSTPLSRSTSTYSGRGGSSNGGGSGYGTVTAAYEWTAQSAQELTVSKGDVLELTSKGRSFANGWTEVIDGTGRKGIVPTSRIK